MNIEGLTITSWWFGTCFPHILGIISPTDYSSEGLKPPTRHRHTDIYIYNIYIYIMSLTIIYKDLVKPW
jgi:hypothetical protein